MLPQPAIAAPSNTVVDGSARFQVLSPTLVRVEYAGNGGFEDRPTFNAVNRNFPVPSFTTAVENGTRVIRTGKLTLRYRQNSGPFSPANLTVDLTAGQTAVTARPSWAGVCGLGQGCEAEALALSGSAELATDHQNYTGSGFVAGFTQAGAKISWSAPVATAGDYAVQFRYANSQGGDGQNTTRTISLSAGSSTTQVSLPVTGSWDTWQTVTTTMHLAAGDNPLALTCTTSDSCNVNFDSVAVTTLGAAYPSPPPAPSSLGGWRRSLDGQSGPAPTAPGLLSRDGWTLLDDTQGAVLNSDQTVTARPSHGGLSYQDGYFFGYGHDYRQGLKDLRDLTGPSVLLPKWAFGVWFSRYFAYSSADYQNSLLPAFRSHQTPLDVLVTDTDWKSPNAWDGWNWNTSLFPDPQGYLDWAKSQGLQVSLNIHPSIATSDPEYAQTAATARTPLGTAQCYSIGTCRTFDFSDPNHLRAYFDLHTPFEQQGVHTWWLDQSNGESGGAPPGVTPDTWINSRYALHGTTADRRGFSFARIGGFSQDYSGFQVPATGAWAEHRYSLAFTGDTSSTWDALAFEAQFTQDEGAAIGLPYVSHDIGGFADNHIPDDLYARWVQLGAFQPIFRLHSNHGDRLPWNYDATAEVSAEKFIRLREALLPYIYSLAKQARDTGLPMTRPMYLNYPDLDAAYQHPDQYLYGDDVLVAPVVSSGNSRTVWFPPGTWTDYFTGAVHIGPSVATVSGDLSTMPVFLRGGGIMASRTDQADNVVQHPVGPMTLDVATSGSGQFDLYEDAGDGSAYQQGQSATTHITNGDGAVDIAAQQGSYPGQVTGRGWTVRVHNTGAPGQVTVNGTALNQTGSGPGWSYDPATRTLTIRTNTLPTSAAVQVRYNGTSASRTGPIVSGVSSNLCVDDADASTDNGNPIQIYGCNGTVAQQWTVASDLRVLGKCMDAKDGGTANGTLIQLYDCNGTGAQQWQQVNGTLRNTESGRCLDDPNFSTANGTQLVLWDCNGGTNQRWTLP
ncbi:MAG TPA: TIM-barrel domain-containing protein, partial [Amycolatopsis sp.]|nr:TIM-barrel domain-containing protein [Amycolatopsis sp.]